MGRGLTLDTSAVIALERLTQRRGSSRMAAVWQRAVARDVRVTVPTAVVLEWWRGQRGPAARLLDGLQVEPLSFELARLAGEALAKIPKGRRRPSLIDAVVVASAAQRGDVVYTSDVEDLSRVSRAAFPSVRVLGI